MLSEQPASSASRCCEMPRWRREVFRSDAAVTVVGIDAMRSTMSHPGAAGKTPDDLATDLFVTTGLEGDTSRHVSRNRPVWSRVAYAQRHQDAWSVEAHAAFWMALLPELPRRDGRPSGRDTFSRAIAALYAHGLDRAAIAEVLGVGLDQIRVGETFSRPSIEQGLRLIGDDPEGDQGQVLMRVTGSGWAPWEALPRVWSPGEDEPVGHFNLRIEHDWVPPGLDYTEAAENELRRRWHAPRA